ncbi:uridine diphosphate-N-acetylglucosamine-binding protein YvcK [Patescibacteria group bacterium]
MKKDSKKINIVVIGGGTGSFVVLAGLKKYPLNLTAIVSVTDSGGSTGRLRTEFGFLPVGDMRQCLAALAQEDSFIRKLLLYRFSKGKGLKGHNLGNLILTALTEISGSEAKALEIASNTFFLKGKILPITTDNIQLKAEYENGKVLNGEHEIDEPKHKGGLLISKLSCGPKSKIYLPVKKAILDANYIILGPGDLYTSILPNLVVGKVKTVLKQTRAKLIYIVNLMTRYSQTPGFTAKDHVDEVEKYLGRKIDYVLINNKKIPEKIIKLYKKEKGYPVRDDLSVSLKYKIIRKNFLKSEMIRKPEADVLQRSYLRHDSEKLARSIISLIK